jgi:hypothetical protein
MKVWHMSRKKKGHIGSSFGDFLNGERMYQETSALAIKRALGREKLGLV